VSWWDSNWAYRIAINVTERNNTNLSGFQVNLSVNTSVLIASGKLNGDCSDMRLLIMLLMFCRFILILAATLQAPRFGLGLICLLIRVRLFICIMVILLLFLLLMVLLL